MFSFLSDRVRAGVAGKAALAALLAAFSFSACATVQMYGVVSSGLTYKHAKHGDKTLEVSGEYAGPRWGIRGWESLDNGMTASFVLEAGFHNDSGRNNSEGGMFSRECQVALSGRWGTIGLGRVGALSSGSGSVNWYWDMEPFETGYNNAGTQVSSLNVWEFYSNSVYYISPLFKGAKFGLLYSFSGRNDDQEDPYWSHRDHFLNIAMRWDRGAHHALLGLESDFWSNERNAGEKRTKAGHNVKFDYAWDTTPALRLYAGGNVFMNQRYMSTKDSWTRFDFDRARTGKGMNGIGLNLGGRYRIGRTEFLGQLQFLDGENKGAPLGREKDFRRYGVAAGVHYLFGNGTKLYAIGSYIDGSGLIEGSVATVSMGMRWDF